MCARACVLRQFFLPGAPHLTGHPLGPLSVFLSCACVCARFWLPEKQQLSFSFSHTPSLSLSLAPSRLFIGSFFSICFLFAHILFFSCGARNGESCAGRCRGGAQKQQTRRRRRLTTTPFSFEVMPSAAAIALARHVGGRERKSLCSRYFFAICTAAGGRAKQQHRVVGAWGRDALLW